MNTAITGAMNKEQRQYFIRRLDEITAEKISAKQTELFGDNIYHIPAPTWGEVFAAIRAGELVLKEGTEDLTRPYMMPTDCEWPELARRQAEFEAKQVALQAYRTQLAVERQGIMDTIVLAGVTGAAEALAGYAQS
jgi:hypothetical protein